LKQSNGQPRRTTPATTVAQRSRLIDLAITVAVQVAIAEPDVRGP
jgi:hypothetical protein